MSPRKPTSDGSDGQSQLNLSWGAGDVDEHGEIHLPEFWSVTELTQRIEGALKSDPVLGGKITVRGELSNVKKSARGHVYFTIKDEGASIGGILWASTALRLKFDMQDGLEVFATGKLSLYRPHGTYSLTVDKMEPVGVGALQLQYQQTKEKLETEGLFNDEYKQDIPEHPKRIGIVTSNTGAVIHDMLRVIKRKNKQVDVLIAPAKVQGEGAAQQIATAIKELNDPSYNLDVIIIGRGGGSFEDLYCFSEEIAVRAVFNSKLPVIAGIGHEPDYSLCDAAADYSASTPTAAAEHAVPDMRQLLGEHQYRVETLYRLMHEELEYADRHLDTQADRFISLAGNVATVGLSLLAQQEERLINGVQVALERSEAKLKQQSAELEALSPLKTMSRGFAVATTSGNAVVNSVKHVKHGDSIRVRVQDGAIDASVTATEKIDLK